MVQIHGGGHQGGEGGGLAQHGNQENHASDLHNEIVSRHAVDSTIDSRTLTDPEMKPETHVERKLKKQEGRTEWTRQKKKTGRGKHKIVHRNVRVAVLSRGCSFTTLPISTLYTVKGRFWG